MIKIYSWIVDEADQILGLERLDGRDDSISLAIVDSKGKLDPHFRDAQGFLKGIVSDAHKKEYKKYAKNS